MLASALPAGTTTGKRKLLGRRIPLPSILDLKDQTGARGKLSRAIKRHRTGSETLKEKATALLVNTTSIHGGRHGMNASEMPPMECRGRRKDNRSAEATWAQGYAPVPPLELRACSCGGGCTRKQHFASIGDGIHGPYWPNWAAKRTAAPHTAGLHHGRHTQLLQDQPHAFYRANQYIITAVLRAPQLLPTPHGGPHKGGHGCTWQYQRTGVVSWHPRLSVVTTDAKRTDTRQGQHGTPRCMKVAAFEYSGGSLAENEFYAKTIGRGSHYVAALLANYPNTFERLPGKTAIVLYDGALHDLPAYKIVGHTEEAVGSNVATPLYEMVPKSAVGGPETPEERYRNAACRTCTQQCHSCGSDATKLRRRTDEHRFADNMLIG